MDWTTDSAGTGEVYPESATTKTRSEQDVASAIDNLFLEGELNPIRKTSIRRAEVAIAQKFSKGRTGLVTSIVDTLLYETTRSFHDESRHLELANGMTTVVLLLDAQLLAEEEGCSARSIQQVFQDLEECGYIHRGRGGNYDGLTGVALTGRAFSDSDTRWVLSMKGKRVDGLEAWLEEKACAQKRPVVRRQPQPSTAPVPTYEETEATAPSPSKIHRSDSHDSEEPVEERTPEISSDTYIYILNSPDVEKSCREIETTRNSAADEASASAKNPDPWVLEIAQCIREAGFRGTLEPGRIRELVGNADESGLDRPTLLEYVDLKLWELSELREVEYGARTVASILNADLKHAGAVIANLSRRFQQAKLRAAWEVRKQEPRPVDSPDTTESLKKDAASEHVAEAIESHQPEEELCDWQRRLKASVSRGNWDEFLSNLRTIEIGEERVALEVRGDDPFVAAWIRTELWRFVCRAFDGKSVELRQLMNYSGGR